MIDVSMGHDEASQSDVLCCWIGDGYLPVVVSFTRRFKSGVEVRTRGTDSYVATHVEMDGERCKLSLLKHTSRAMHETSDLIYL